MAMNHQANSVKINSLLDKVNGLLRQQFLKHWRNETGVDWDNQSVSQFVSGVGKWVYVNAERIQREAISSGDVNRWDTTLLTNALIHTQFKKSDIKTNERNKEREMLQLMNNVRNTLSHHPSGINIEDKTFNSLWADAMKVFEFFGGSTSEINMDEATLNTNESDAVNITKAKQLKEEGNVMYGNAKCNEAIELYTKAISLSGLPNFELAILYSNRSAAYLEVSKSNEGQIDTELAYMALLDAKEAVERNRTWFRGYLRVGNAYVTLQKFDKALKYFDSAVAFCPTRPEIVTARDNCRMKIRQDRRQEELNPTNMPRTDQELVDHFQTRIEFTGDSSAAKKILGDAATTRDKVCPGAIQVQEAHKLSQSRNYELAAKKYSKAAALGNADGLYNLGLLYKHGKGVAQDFKMYVKLLREAALQPHLLQGNIPENVLNSLSPEESKIWKDLQSIHISGEERSFGPTVHKSQNFDFAQISKYAENGSKTAQELMKAHEHLEYGTRTLINSSSMCKLPMGEAVVQHLVTAHFCKCYGLAHIVVQLPQFLHSKFSTILNKVMQSLDPNQPAELDRWTRICYAYLNYNNLEHCLEFTKGSQVKYPEEICFHRAHVSMLGFLKKYDEGVSEGNKSSQQFPNDPELLYCRAVHMRLVTIPNIENSVAAYEQFICAAPPDHRQVPEAYYAIANLFFLKFVKCERNDLEYAAKVEEFYQKGIDAEHIQLRCFLPYDSPSKDLLVQVNLKLIRIHSSSINQTCSTRNAQSGVSLQSEQQLTRPKLDEDRVEKLTDVNRVFHIKAHRTTFAEHQIELGSPKYTKYRITNMTSNAKKEKALTVQNEFKKITFNEMDSCADKVYEGFAIDVTSVEDPCGMGVFPSIQLALEDKNTNVMRAFVYNFPHSDPKVIEEALGFGAKFTILNPYMHLASGGLFGIRVDDVSMLVMQSPGGVQNKCRFCGSDNAPKRCGRCKRASYCNAECQNYDWKILDHKSVCLKAEQNKN